MVLRDRVRAPIPWIDLERAEVNQIYVLDLGLLIVIFLENFMVEVDGPLIVLKVFATSLSFFPCFKKLREFVIISDRGRRT